ncbi:MAG: MFS transporter [Anaerolineales bacterium]
MFALLRQRNYALLWSSQLVSMTGTWALFAALPFFVFQLTGSVLATGIMFFVEVIPPILLGSVAGVFVDRWDRRWTMIGANVTRGLLLLLLLAFRSAEQVWIVYVVAFLESVANLFFGPANNALLPQLVGKDELVTANSLDALGENVARILGPALGGALLASLGLTAVALIDVASYLIGGLLIYFINVSAVQRAASDKSIRAEWVGFWREWIEGLRLVLQN